MAKIKTSRERMRVCARRERFTAFPIFPNNVNSYGIIFVDEVGRSRLKYYSSRGTEITDQELFSKKYDWYVPIVREALIEVDKNPFLNLKTFAY